MKYIHRLLILSTTFQSTTAFIPSSIRKGTNWGRPALIFSPDGERYYDDDYFLEEEQHQNPTVTSLHNEIIDYLNQPQFVGPLGVLAAAKADVDLSSIHLVKVEAIDSRYMQIAATSCDNMSCVNLLMDLYFPTPKESLCQQHVIDELGVLYQQANAILASRGVQAQIQKSRDNLLQEKVISFPDWWLKDMDQSLHNAALDLRKVLNEDSAYMEDLKELVIRHQAEAFHPNQNKFLLTNVELAIVRKVGRNGIILGATDGKRQIQVPIRFPKQAQSVDELQELVLATIEKGNRYFEIEQEEQKSIAVDTRIEDDNILDAAATEIIETESHNDAVENLALFGVKTGAQKITNDGDEDKEAELHSREVNKELTFSITSSNEHEDLENSALDFTIGHSFSLDDQEFYGSYVATQKIELADKIPTVSGRLEADRQHGKSDGEDREDEKTYSALEEIQAPSQHETFTPVPLPARMVLEKMAHEIESIQKTPILESLSKKFARTVEKVTKAKR